MATQESISNGLPCDFNSFLKHPLKITWRVLRWSKLNSHEYKRVHIISTPTLMLAHTSHLPDNLQQNQMIMLVNAKSGVWCDYCKYRFGTNNLRGQQQAAWTVISQHPRSKDAKRSYCRSCAEDVQRWADGTIFPLSDQAEYLMKQEELPSGI